MKKIPFALGRAAGVAAQEAKAEPQFENSARGQAVFAGLVVSTRGKPFTVLSINGDNFLSKLGDPIHPRHSEQFEPIRHVAQAVNGGRGYVVRVVPKDMQIPILRFKETTTAPKPVTTPVYAPKSGLTTSSSTLRADGKDVVTLAFTARNADGSLLTGLKNIMFKAIGNYPPKFGDVYEINGTYYVDMTATRSDTQIILVLDGNDQLGQFSVNITLTPAIVDPAKSSITTDKGVIDNDGKDKALITFNAMDQDGNPVAGMTNIDFMAQGAANVVLDKMVETSPGVYQTKISGFQPGTMTVSPRQDGKRLAPLGVDVQLADVITGVAIDDTLSTFDVLPQDIYNDGKDSSLLTFTAHDAKGRLIKGISNLTLTVTGITGFTQPVFTETSSGVYQARLYATSVGRAEIIPHEGARAITSMKKNIDVLHTVPIDLGKTTFTQSKRRMLNDKKDSVMLTFSVKDAQGNPIKGPPGITFREDNGNATFSPVSEIKAGELVVYVTSDYTGTLNVKPYQYGQPLGTYNAQMVCAGIPVLTFSNCRMTSDVTVIQANGTDTITMKFLAKDQMGEPMSGLGISFVTNDIPSGIRIVPQVEQNGEYKALITGTEIHNGNITLVYQGQPLGTFSRPVNIRPVHGKIDWALSSFDLSATSVKANNRDLITATATLLDGYSAPVLGYTKLGNQAEGLTNVNMSQPQEQGNGVYTFEIGSLSDGLAQIHLMDDGQVVADPRFAKPLRFILVRGIIDPDFSDFDADVNEIYDDNKTAVTVTLTAVDNLGNAVKGLRDINFEVSSSSVSAKTSVTEIAAGVYTQSLISGTIGTFDVIPEKNYAQIGAGKFSETINVKAAPVINMTASKLTLDNVQLIADGVTIKKMTLKLVDQYNQPFDMSGITLKVENMPGVTVHAPVQTQPDTVEYAITGITPFSTNGTITVQSNGRDVDSRLVAAFHVNPVHGKIDGAKSGLYMLPDNIDADGRAVSRIVLEARDGYNDRITGQAAHFTFSSSLAGVVIGATRETSAGIYEAQLTSRFPGTATIIAKVDGATVDQLATVNVTLRDVSGIPYMPDCVFSTALVGNPGSIYDQGNQTFDLTYKLVDALGDPIGGQNVTFNADNPSAILSQTFEYSTGEYTVTVSARTPAAITLSPVINGATYTGAKTFTFLVLASPELDAAYSRLSFNPQSAIADGTAEITVTYSAYDQYGQPFPGLSGLTLEVRQLSGALAGGAFIDQKDGTYTTTLKSSTVGTASVGISENGNLLATPRVDISFTPVPGVIDPARCSFDVTPPDIDGNGTDVATVTFRAVDGLGDDIPGLSGIRFGMNGLTDSAGRSASFTNASGEATEISPAHYTATITSLGGATGTIWVYNGSTRIDSLEATLRVRDMRGILNGGHSTLTVVKPSIQAMMAERVFTPADDSDYVTEVTFQAEDQFNQPITGIQFGNNKALLFVETSGAVPIQVDYRGESTTTPGLYHAYVRTSTPGAAVIDVQYNNQLLTGVQEASLTVTAAPTIDWAASVLEPELDVVENNTLNQVALTFTPVDTNGDPVTGLQGAHFDIELQTGSLTAAEQTLTGLGSLTPVSTVSDGVYRVRVTLTGNDISDQFEPVYAIKWKGTQQSAPTATFSLQPQHGVLNLAHSSFEVTNDEILDDPLATGYVPVYVKFKPRDWYDAPILSLTLSEVEFVPTGPAGAQFGAMTRTVEASGDVVFQAELRTQTAGEVDIALWLKGVEVTQAKYQLDVESIEPVYTALDPTITMISVVPDSAQIGYDTNFTASLLAYDDQGNELYNIRNLSLKVTPPIVTFDPLKDDTFPGIYNTSLYIGNQSGTFTVEVLQGGVPTGIVSNSVTIHPAERMAGSASTWAVTPAFVYAQDTTSHIDVEFHAVATDGTPAADSQHMVITTDDPAAIIGAITETSPGTYSTRITWNGDLTRGQLHITATQAGVAVGSTQVEVRSYPTVSSAYSKIEFSPANDQPVADGQDKLHVVLHLKDNNNQVISGFLNLIEVVYPGFTGLIPNLKSESNTEPGRYDFFFMSRTPGTGLLGVEFNGVSTGINASFKFLDVYGFDPANAAIEVVDLTSGGVVTTAPANHSLSVRFKPSVPDDPNYDLTRHTVRFIDTSGNLTFSTVSKTASGASANLTIKNMTVNTNAIFTVEVDGHTIPGVQATLTIPAASAQNLIGNSPLNFSTSDTFTTVLSAIDIPNDGYGRAHVQMVLQDANGNALDYSVILGLGSRIGFVSSPAGMGFTAATAAGNILTTMGWVGDIGVAESFEVYPTLDGQRLGTSKGTVNFTATNYVKTLVDNAASTLTGSVVSLTDANQTNPVTMLSYQTVYATLSLKMANGVGPGIDLTKHNVSVTGGAGLFTISSVTKATDKVTFQIRAVLSSSNSMPSQTFNVSIDGYPLTSANLKLPVKLNYGVSPAVIAKSTLSMARLGDRYVSVVLTDLKATEEFRFQVDTPSDVKLSKVRLSMADTKGLLTITNQNPAGASTETSWVFNAKANSNEDIDTVAYVLLEGQRVTGLEKNIKIAKDDPFAGKNLGRTVTATVSGAKIFERAQTASGGKLVVTFDPSLAGVTGIDMSKFNMKIADSRGILSEVQTVNKGTTLEATLAAIPAGGYTTTIYVTKDGVGIGSLAKFDLLVFDNDVEHASSYMSGVAVAPVAAVNKSISIQYVMRDDKGNAIATPGDAPDIYTAPYGGVLDATAIPSGTPVAGNPYIWLGKTTTGKISGNDYRVGWKLKGRLITDPFVMPRLRLISVVPTRHLTNFGGTSYDDRNVYLSFMHDGTVYAGEEYILALQAMSVNSVSTGSAYRDSNQVKLVEANGKAFTWSIVPENEMPVDSFSTLFRVRFPSATEEYNLAVTIAGKSHPTSEVKIKPSGLSYGLNPAASSININGKKKVYAVAGSIITITLELIGTSLGTPNLVMKDSLGIMTFGSAMKTGNVFTIRATVKADAVLGEETHIYPVYAKIDLKSLNVRVSIASGAKAAENPASYCYWMASVAPGATAAYGLAVAPANGSVTMTFNKYGRVKNSAQASNFNLEKKTLTFKEANNQLTLKTSTDNTYSTVITATPANPDGGAYTRVYPVIDGVEYPNCSFNVVFTPKMSLSQYFYIDQSKIFDSSTEWKKDTIRTVSSGSKLTIKIGLSDSKGDYLANALYGFIKVVDSAGIMTFSSPAIETSTGKIIVTATINSVDATTMTEIVPIFTYPTNIVIPELVRAVKVKSVSGAYDDYEPVFSGEATLNLISDAQSSFTTSKTVLTGDGEELELTFVARDHEGKPLPGLVLAFRSSNPLLDIGNVVDHGFGTYTATAHAHSFDYATTVEVVNGGTATGIKQIIDVQPQQLPEPLILEPLISARSPNSLYPSVAPCDGRTAMVATLNLMERSGEPLAGADVLLVAMDGSTDVTIGKVEETAPGVYSAKVTSRKVGPLILGWYANGMYIKGQRGGFHSVTTAQAVAAHPPKQTRAAASPAPVTIPTYIEVVPATVGPQDEITLEADDLMVIYPDDGDASTNRLINIEKDPTYADKWILSLLEMNAIGVSSLSEMVRFSLDPNDTDYAGLPAWLPYQLEKTSSRLRAVVRSGAVMPSTFTGVQGIPFVGGSDGTLSSITTDDYRIALRALEASTVNYTVMLGLGIYDVSVLRLLAQHSHERRIDMFCDAPPSADPMKAMMFTASLGFSNYPHVAVYHFPYSSRDIYTGTQVTFGLSGDVFRSKAQGVAKVPYIGGWHYSPAGMARGVVQRRSITPLAAAEGIDREEYVRLRLNTVAPAADGNMQIDDSLTTYLHEDGQQYQHVSSVLNALARDINDICTVIKHEPGNHPEIDLTRELGLLFEDYTRAGALVVPRDPDQGSSPYDFNVVNTDFDTWLVQYAVCVVGTARRITCEPILYR